VDSAGRCITQSLRCTLLYGKGDQHRMIDGMTSLQYFEFVKGHVGDGFKLFRDDQKIAICWLFRLSDHWYSIHMISEFFSRRNPKASLSPST